MRYKVYRQANFLEKNRKEAHQVALLMLKGQEKLTAEEREKVLIFCETYPDIAMDYALNA